MGYDPFRAECAACFDEENVLCPKRSEDPFADRFRFLGILFSVYTAFGNSRDPCTLRSVFGGFASEGEELGNSDPCRVASDLSVKLA